MTTTFTATVGDTVEFDLTVLDANGVAAPVPTDLAFAASPAGLLGAFSSLASPKVGFTAPVEAAGSVKVTATGTNAAGTSLVAEADGTLNSPLAVSMVLTATVIPKP